MSKYLLDKFLFTVDRDPDLVERYREDPRGTVVARVAVPFRSPSGAAMAPQVSIGACSMGDIW